MLKIVDLEFHPKFVKPFYGGLMGFNFTRKEITPDAITFLKSVRSLRSELSNTEILWMLNHSWRPAKVGAWIIGLCRIDELEKDLIKFLKKHSSHNEHIIINLTLFNSNNGNLALREYVFRYLEIILKYAKDGKAYLAVDSFQTSSLIWAFNAIKYLDSINSTTHYQNMINSAIWSSIKEELYDFAELNPRDKHLYDFFLTSESQDNGFESAMEIITKSMINTI